MTTPAHAILSCEDVQPLLPLVADNALDQTIDPALFEHLAKCSECQAELARQDLLTIALERSRTTPPPLASKRLFFPRRWQLAAAATLLLAVGAWQTAQWLTPVPDSTPSVEVVRVVDTDGTVRFVVRDGDRVRVVAPSGNDPRHATPDRSDVQAVDLKRWR